MNQTFKEYLMERCINSTHALDDDLPDVYESWIAEQDIEDVIEWAEKWHNKEVKPLEMYYHFQEANKGGVKHRERVMKRFNSIFWVFNG